MVNHVLSAGVVGLLFSVLILPDLIAEEALLPAPDKPGPYPVGVTTMTFVDHSREDPATKGPRTLLTEVWYPATEDARSLPPNRISEFFRKNQSPELALLLLVAFGMELEEADKSFKNFAVRDARIADGLFPLLLFSHGNGGLRMQNTFWCEHLASHGYVVMAPDHTGNCAVTFVNGELVVYDDTREGRDRAAKDRPRDLSFLIDAMALLNKGNDSRFLGKVDMNRIAAAGHSFGGFTCTWLADADARIKAIIPMAGVAEDRINYACPAMVFIAAEDATLNQEKVGMMRRYYAESQGPRYCVEFKDAGHFSFTEMYQLKPDFGDGIGQGKRVTNGEPLTYPTMEQVFPLVNGYSTAFLGKLLKGMDGYNAYLAENHAPDAIVYQNGATP